MFLFSYLLFSVIYTIAGGINHDGDNYIYSVIAWNTDYAKAIGVSIGAIVAEAVLFLLIVGIYLLKLLCRSKCHQAEVDVDDSRRQSVFTVSSKWPKLQRPLDSVSYDSSL
jgi:hypothetical protein